MPNIPPARPPIDLDALMQPVATVILRGAPVSVMPLDGAAYHALSALASEAVPDVKRLYGIARRCLPALTEDQVDGLSAAQVQAVIQIAGGQIEQVETAFPNTSGGRKGGRRRPSAPATPSAS